MSYEHPNDGFLICPCGRTVQVDPDHVVRPHRPGLTAGMPNLGSRRRRKTAWCDQQGREERAVEFVRTARRR